MTQKVKIKDEFYDMLEEQWGYEVSVVIEHESPSFYYLKVGSVLFVYSKDTHEWEIIK